MILICSIHGACRYWLNLISGEVGVIERIDVDGNASVQLSGDEGLSQVFTLDRLAHGVRNIYILRPESSVPDACVSMNTSSPLKKIGFGPLF